MSSFAIEDIEFEGIQGTIQRAKPIFDQFTRLGSNETYVQRLKTESPLSQIRVWNIQASYTECEAKLSALNVYLGKRVGASVSGNVSGSDVSVKFFALYLLDYTYTIKAGANNKHLLTVDMIIKVDEDSVGAEG